MSNVLINAYDGAGYLGKGAGTPPPKRDGVKVSYRATVKTFRELGDQALNAADFERTMHLPVGKGRLACDPDTGEFDKDAPRKPYNKEDHPQYPIALHSTITEGEHIVVFTDEERDQAIATRKWSLKPLEKKRRFMLTPEDQLVNLKGQVEAERAGRLEQEKRFDAFLEQGKAPEESTLLAKKVEEQASVIEELRAGMRRLMEMAMNKPAVSAAVESEDEGEDTPAPEDEDEETVLPAAAVRGRRAIKN